MKGSASRSAARYALAAVMVVGPAGLLAACGAGGPDPGTDATPASARSTGPDKDASESLTPYEEPDYTYTLRRECFCADGGIPVSVTVRDGDVVAAVYVRKGLGHPAGAPAARWDRLTINDVIADARSARAGGAHLVRVTWPDGQDYPTSVFIDQDVNAMDEEVGYRISNVSPG